MRGRAEVIRLVFTAAGQEYEDFRIQKGEWPQYKVKAPFGQVPYLEIKKGSDTIVLAQSIAIGK